MLLKISIFFLFFTVVGHASDAVDELAARLKNLSHRPLRSFDEINKLVSYAIENEFSAEEVLRACDLALLVSPENFANRVMIYGNPENVIHIFSSRYYSKTMNDSYWQHSTIGRYYNFDSEITRRSDSLLFFAMQKKKERDTSSFGLFEERLFYLFSLKFSEQQPDAQAMFDVLRGEKINPRNLEIFWAKMFSDLNLLSDPNHKFGLIIKTRKRELIFGRSEVDHLRQLLAVFEERPDLADHLFSYLEMNRTVYPKEKIAAFVLKNNNSFEMLKKGIVPRIEDVLLPTKEWQKIYGTDRSKLRAFRLFNELNDFQYAKQKAVETELRKISFSGALTLAEGHGGELSLAYASGGELTTVEGGAMVEGVGSTSCEKDLLTRFLNFFKRR